MLSMNKKTLEVNPNYINDYFSRSGDSAALVFVDDPTIAYNHLAIGIVVWGHDDSSHIIYNWRVALSRKSSKCACVTDIYKIPSGEKIRGKLNSRGFFSP